MLVLSVIDITLVYWGRNESEGQISTTLVKGSVNVEVKNKIGKIYKWKLKPSEKAVCDINEGKISITKVNTIYETA